MSDRADWRITITNTNKLPSSIHDRTRQSCVLSDRFCQLNADFFNRLKVWLSQRTIPPPEKMIPHETQREAIGTAMTHFKDNARGHLILPCGTGKTLSAMWIAEGLGGKRILVIVPSLALLSQTLREWAVNTSLKPFRYLCLCSDTSVDLGNDSPVEHLYEMDVPVTTNVDVVSEYLKAEGNTTSVLFSTYQSSQVLSEASLNANIHFDVAIFDEAHRTAGMHNSIWGLALDDKNVPVKKRLFMTATPRIYAPHITKKAEDKDILLCSMDDHAIYGAPIYKMSFGQAIERDLITPYKVVVIYVTDAEVIELVNKGKKILTAENQEWDAKALAKRVALVKAINAYGLKKMFTFHSRVSGAAEFTNNDSPYSFKSIINLLDINIPEKNDIKCFHVNGEMSSGERNARLEEFKKAQIAIMSNARCLTEGVDVPLVDAIAFIDPKKSIIDIVQATGRAIRKAKGKEKGYIFVPVFVGEEADPEKYLDSSDFKIVWQVLQAMVDHDQHMQDVISRLRIRQGMGEEGSKEWNAAMAEYREKVEFFNLPNKVDQARFIEALTTKTVEVIARQWDFWFGLMIKYKEQHGTANAPQSYKTPEGFSLGAWQSNQKTIFKNGKLERDRIKKFEEIGFVLETREETFSKGIEETLRYKEQHGPSNAPSNYKTPDGFNLGAWQDKQRQYFRNGTLEQDRIKKLEGIGLDLGESPEELFNKGFEETLRYKEQHGTANAPSNYKTLEGFNLGNWQTRQKQNFRNGNLGQDRIKKLEDIGFVCRVRKESFNKGFEETLRYKEQHGTANASSNYKTPEGFNLGNWQARQKQYFRNGMLGQDEIKKLEDIGFVCGVQKESSKESFNKGFEETLRYKEQHGTANAPSNYKTPDGFNLGAWQTRQRQKFRNGKLGQYGIKKLEGIGLVWGESPEELFNKGFEETLRYKEQHGTANAPSNYKTPDGFNLGAWQDKQRQYFRNSKLERDRIKILEEIGFGVWQDKQRQKFRNGKLEQDRIKKLEEIGFVWSRVT